MFYVYAYLRDRDSATAKAGTPYYIGKGKNWRAWSKHAIENFVPKDRNNIVILENNLTEIGAFALERRYIAWYGRKNLGTGILANLTDGGEGASGRVISVAIRQNLSIKNKGKILSQETRDKISSAGIGRIRKKSSSLKALNTRTKNGKLVHTDATKKKISDYRKNTPLTSAQLLVLEEMSKKNRGAMAWNRGLKTGPRTDEQIKHMEISQQERYRIQKVDRDEQYLQSPSYCQYCSVILDFRKRNYKFCGRLCTAKDKRK